jgi:hnRNP-L/PTB/hephaestus splicing factor
VRGLPNFTTESELASLCSPFGIPQKTLLLNNKQQAFIQMDSIDAATNLVGRYAVAPVSIRGKPIFFQFSNRTEVKTASGGSSIQDGQSQTPSAILLVSVLNCRVPVTLENIHQVFKPYGDVLKIVTFVKENSFKALVQMGSIDQALNAKLLLEGKDMFQGCCHLRIGFSKLSDLSVKQNGPRSRDFSVPESFGGFEQKGGSFGGFEQKGALFGQQQFQQQQQQQQQQTPQFQGPSYSAPPPFQGGFDAKGAFTGGPSFQGGSVLLVNNLTPGQIDCDKLFTLFGVYGDVLRVKILYNKRDTALIQFATPQQAQTAQIHLNRLFLHTKEINVNTSKHTEVALPQRDAEFESASLTKDFTGSPVHRFRHRGARTTKNINPPSQVLHLSNLYEGCTEEDLKKIFVTENTGAVVQFFPSNRKMAYVKLDNVHEGVLALIRTHNTKLGDKYMRVSFSHKEPGSVTGQDEHHTGES